LFELAGVFGTLLSRITKKICSIIKNLLKNLQHFRIFGNLIELNNLVPKKPVNELPEF